VCVCVALIEPDDVAKRVGKSCLSAKHGNCFVVDSFIDAKNAGVKCLKAVKSTMGSNRDFSRFENPELLVDLGSSFEW